MNLTPEQITVLETALTERMLRIGCTIFGCNERLRAARAGLSDELPRHIEVELKGWVAHREVVRGTWDALQALLGREAA